MASAGSGAEFAELDVAKVVRLAEQVKDFVRCRANSGHLADVGWTAQFAPSRPLVAIDLEGRSCPLMRHSRLHR